MNSTRFFVRQRLIPSLIVMTLNLSVLAALTQVSQAWSQTAAQPKLATIDLQAGIHKIRAEVAADSNSRSAGLMFRDRLGPNEGMLFAFERPSAQCFWMRNTKIPLSIAFIDDAGVIVNIADMKPFDEASHCSAKPVRFALEMEQGWFAKRGIAAGSALSNEQMFGGRTK
jgi:uncharacterized protein